MITVNYNNNRGLSTKYFIIKVSYKDDQEVIGLDKVLQTKLSLDQVATILATYVKDTYRLTISEANNSIPKGYYETFTIDNIASTISRIRFIKKYSVKVPKLVYIDKNIVEEL